jgi:tRNA modification GTPase
MLVDLIARTEAAVEFVDEAGTHLPSGALHAGLRAALARCAALLAGFRAGRLVREGATVVLVGRPNVGKSSLFNALLERERAIVAALPGTTRDTLEETLDLDGVPVRLVDTAGMREGGDVVESEGIRRARAASSEADLVLVVHDGSHPSSVDAPDAGARARTLVVENKLDLLAPSERLHSSLETDVARVSARTGEGLVELRRRLRELLLGAAPLEEPIVSNVRHARALEAASIALERATQALAAGFTEEIALEDLREAVERIGEITGAVGTEELFDRIFSTFCIGK